MLDSLTPPTDNLYKFIAIGGLVFALIPFIYLFKEQARDREQYINAQATLFADGYVEGSGEPKETELRRAYFHRESAMAQANTLLHSTTTVAAHSTGICICVSFVGFVAWWFRVQRYEDAILRAEAARATKGDRLP